MKISGGFGLSSIEVTDNNDYKRLAQSESEWSALEDGGFEEDGFKDLGRFTCEGLPRRNANE